METVGAYEAKTHLPKLLDRVQRGESITITRHGRPVAMLVPSTAVHGPEMREIVHQFRQYCADQGRTLGEVSVGQLIREGRKY